MFMNRMLGPIVRERVGEAQLNAGMNGEPLDGDLGSSRSRLNPRASLQNKTAHPHVDDE
jgi:hypothetical protein